MWGRGLREIESVYLATFGQGARVVGVTAVVSGSGVTTLTGALAERSQRQHRTLVIGLSEPTAAVPAQASQWMPDSTDILKYVVSDERGFDRLSAAPLPEASFAFRSAVAMRGLVDRLLETYEAIIIDLAPVYPRERVAVPVATVVAACDSVILLCLAARVRRASLARAVSALRQANAPLQGVVVNDRYNQTPGEEIISGVSRWSRFAPAFAQRITDLVNRSRLLNTKL